MPGIMTVSIKQAVYTGYHGLYPEERKTGNRFEVSLDVSYEPQPGEIGRLDATINYQTLHEMILASMQEPTGLLETLAQRITGQVKDRFPQTRSARISITKLHPPMSGFSGQVSVTWEEKY